MVTIIVAINKNNVIGCNNSIPWKNKEDLNFFKNTTTNNIVIMGRKTFESIGKTLPNRINIVISKTLSGNSKDLYFCSSPLKALELAKKFFNKEIFIIGGETIYKEFLDLADTLLISCIDNYSMGNCFFPEINPQKFKLAKSKIFKTFILRKYTRIENTCN